MLINKFLHNPNQIKGTTFCKLPSHPWTLEKFQICDTELLLLSPTLLLLIQFFILLHILINCKGKMKIYLLLIFIQFYCIYKYTSIKIQLELKKNIVNFGCGINYKYDGMLAHSFDRFYVVIKFILPSIMDLNFSKLNYENTCAYLGDRNICYVGTKKYLLDLLAFWEKIEPYVFCYKRQIKSYNNTAHNI